MNIIGIGKKKPAEAIPSPSVRNEARKYSVGTQLAFMPDEVLGQSWYFRFLTLIYYYGFVYFHGFDIIGIDKIDPNEGCLFISRHSTHNAEIQGAIVCGYHRTGKVIRSLIHRLLIPWFPILRLMGSVAGKRETAVSLLKSGFWVGVIPGGADEGMVGHENAYRVHWPEKRKGFVHVAIEAQVPFVPIFLANQEEMRWNPVLYFWNLFRLGRLYSFILNLNLPLLTPILNFIGPITWFSMTWFQIPIPVQLTLYIGDPISYNLSKDSVDDIVERCHLSLQALINRYQPQGKSYRIAIQQRIDSLHKFWLGKTLRQIY